VSVPGLVQRVFSSKQSGATPRFGSASGEGSGPMIPPRRVQLLPRQTAVDVVGAPPGALLVPAWRVNMAKPKSCPGSARLELPPAERPAAPAARP